MSFGLYIEINGRKIQIHSKWEDSSRCRDHNEEKCTIAHAHADWQTDGD